MGRNGITEGKNGQRTLPRGEVLAEYLDWSPLTHDDRCRTLVLVANHNNGEYIVGWLPDGETEWTSGIYHKSYRLAVELFSHLMVSAMEDSV